MEITNGQRIDALKGLCQAWLDLNGAEKAFDEGCELTQRIIREIGTDVLGSELSSSSLMDLLVGDLAIMRSGIARAITTSIAQLTAPVADGTGGYVHPPLHATNNPAVPRCTEFHDGIGVRCPLPYKHEGPCDFSERGALGACRGNFKGRYCGLPVAHEGAHEYFCGQHWAAGHCTFLLGHKGPCSTNQGHED